MDGGFAFKGRPAVFYKLWSIRRGIIAPILIIIGYRTRIAALAVLFNMLMAVLLVFRYLLFTLKEAGGGWIIELEALFLPAPLLYSLPAEVNMLSLQKAPGIDKISFKQCFLSLYFKPYKFFV